MPKKPPNEKEPETGDVRQRIVSAAAKLIASDGPEAATTRAVAAAASVQAPTIYRLFGDKRGLLAAVAADAIADYVADKANRKPLKDAVHDLRMGWDLHIAFCLENPHLFAIMEMDPQRSPAAESVAGGIDVLRRRIHAVARAGRLRVTEDRAVNMVRAAGVGTVVTLLSQPVGQRDNGLIEASREAVIASITGTSSGHADEGLGSHAVALAASLKQVQSLSLGERQLMLELLERIARGPGGA